jgi:hypothetical protein
MEIVVQQETGKVPVTVFHLQGELISDEELRNQAQEVFDAGARDLLLDLTKVSFISSAGLRGIHALYVLFHADAQDKAVQRGIIAGTYKAPHLKLLNPSKTAMKALTVSGYDMFLETGTNLRAMVNSF